MLTKRLLRPDEHDRFIAFNKANGGAPVEPTYLTNARVWIFYRRAAPNQWVAAYATNTHAPFRCLSVLSHEQRTCSLRQHGLSEQRLVELTLLSRDKTLRWLPGERDYYYRMGFLDTLRTGKRYVLGGTTDPNLFAFQRNLLDRVLFEGDLDFEGDIKHGWLMYTSWVGAVQNALVYGWRQLAVMLFPRPKQVGSPAH
jgi:hypothetical protein